MLLSRKKAFLGNDLFNPSHCKIDRRLVIGAVCFGLGWGIAGLCPGPVIALFSVFDMQIHVVWFGCMIVGQQIAAALETHLDKQVTSKSEIPELNNEGTSRRQVEIIDCDGGGGDSDRMENNLITNHNDASPK